MEESLKDKEFYGNGMAYDGAFSRKDIKLAVIMLKQKICKKTYPSGERGSMCDIVCPTLLKMKRKPKWYQNMTLPKRKKKCCICKTIDKLFPVVSLITSSQKEIVCPECKVEFICSCEVEEHNKTCIGLTQSKKKGGG